MSEMLSAATVWLSPWLAEKKGMLSVYGRVTATSIFLQRSIFALMYVYFILAVIILFNSWFCFNE